MRQCKTPRAARETGGSLSGNQVKRLGNDGIEAIDVHPDVRLALCAQRAPFFRKHANLSAMCHCKT
jgi:hypothetical protein